MLCPHHIFMDQSVSELWRAASTFIPWQSPPPAPLALNRTFPAGESIFTTHPHTIISLDYVESEKRRAEFLRACPELVIVDEAHTCASAGAGRHQRHESEGLVVGPQLAAS